MKCTGDRCPFKHDDSKKGTGKRELHDGNDSIVNQVTRKLKDELKIAINEIKENKKKDTEDKDTSDVWKSMLAGIYMINLK